MGVDLVSVTCCPKTETRELQIRRLLRGGVSMCRHMAGVNEISSVRAHVNNEGGRAVSSVSQ